MTVDHAPEGLSAEELDVSVAIKAQNPDLETAWRKIAWWESTCAYWYEEAQKGYAVREHTAALSAERDALRERVEALATTWEQIHATIEPILGEPPQGQVIAHAEQLLAALHPDPSEESTDA